MKRIFPFFLAGILLLSFSACSSETSGPDQVSSTESSTVQPPETDSDTINDFLSLAEDYDGFVFGTPVHWAGAAGAITSFLDRAFYADLNGGGRRFYLKPAAAIMSARRAGTTATWDQLNKYFGLMQMPIITSRYWNMVHGTTSQEVMQDHEGLATLRTLGHNMAYFLKCKEVGSKLVPLPPEEPWEMTNFIR